MSRTYTPKLPPHWEHFIGVVPIDLEDELLTWDEDIFSARWTCPESGDEWNIWLDGGKGLTTWQVMLIIVEEPNEDGVLERDHQRIMRDFLDTPEQVQAWIDRAVDIAARWNAEPQNEPKMKPRKDQG
jgi:hypothetical protein